MTRHSACLGRLRKYASLVLLVSLMMASATAQDDPSPGLADLDEAIVKKIDAKSMEDLEQVGNLVESAIAKGLDEENRAFAQKMLGGIELQKGETLVAEMAAQMRSRGGQAKLQRMRTEALRSLEKAVQSDPTLVEGHLLIARLSILPGGNPKRALDAASAAIEQLKGDPEKQSEAYVLRAVLQESDELRRQDLDAAIKADDSNADAYQARALLRLQSDDAEGAVEDLRTLLEKDPTNTAAAVAASEALLQLDRSDDAIAILDQAITAQPNAPLYILRAEIRRAADKLDEALDDLDRALAIDAKSPAALLLRAEVKLRKEDVDGARSDVDAAMELQPGNARGVYLRSLIAAQQKRYTDAINDMKLLARNQPENSLWALQLGNFYQLDQRPAKAIEVATEILKGDPSQWQALRLRGDAYLSINKHSEAIADYEAALQTKLGDEESLETDLDAMSKTARSGLLNNLAWVLSTSPKDDLRNGQRAIEVATEAAELTEYKEAHILSTLAAAYAESGNFEKAIEWSTKAVEFGTEEENEQLEQLKNELKSYQEGKPWREEQSVEENKVPILAPEDIIDT